MKQYLTIQYSLSLWENTLLTLFPYIITRHVTHNLNIIIKIGGGKQNTENTSTAKNSWKHNTTNTYNNTKNQMCAHWAGEARQQRHLQGQQQVLVLAALMLYCMSTVRCANVCPLGAYSTVHSDPRVALPDSVGALVSGLTPCTRHWLGCFCDGTHWSSLVS